MRRAAALGPQGIAVAALAGDRYARPELERQAASGVSMDRQRLRARVEAATLGGVDFGEPARNGGHSEQEGDLFDLSTPSPSPGYLDTRPAWDCVGAGASSLVPLLRRERERGGR